MSTPLATPEQLGVYLTGTPLAADDARALLMLQMAHDRCEMYVSPVPALGLGIELGIAARAFNNVTSAHQMSLGSASVSFGAQNSSMGVGGLYISKSEIRDLRRLAGRTGAFSVDMLPAMTPIGSVPSVTAVDPANSATGDLVRIEGNGFFGSNTLTFGGAAALFVVVSDSVIHAQMPTGSAGDAAVVLTNTNGASSPFAYIRA